MTDINSCTFGVDIVKNGVIVKPGPVGDYCRRGESLYDLAEVMVFSSSEAFQAWAASVFPAESK